MIESKNNLKIKDSIHVDGEIHSLFCMSIGKFAKILKPLYFIADIYD